MGPFPNKLGIVSCSSSEDCKEDGSVDKDVALFEEEAVNDREVSFDKAVDLFCVALFEEVFGVGSINVDKDDRLFFFLTKMYVYFLWRRRL